MTDRLLVLSPEAIFPTNAGGRAAVLAQCHALKEAGFTVDLVVFHRQPVAPRDIIRHEALADRVVFVRRRSLAASTLAAPLEPYQVSSRWLDRDAVGTIEERMPRPKLMVAQQEWTVDAARRLWAEAPVPILLSSHNDESAYYGDQLRAARGLRRQYLRLEHLRLKATLRRITAAVSAVVTLSTQDEGAYAGLRVQTIPHPLGEATHREPLDVTAPRALFVGALDMPHAVEGLLWFVREVWPIVLDWVPSAVFEVAGRRAAAPLRDLLHRTEGVHFRGEVPDLDPLYASAAVFVNPVFLGSGVNIKLAEPLGLGIPSVTTSVGARGYEGLGDALLAADDAHSFAQHCALLLNDPQHSSRISRMLVARAAALRLPAVAALWRDAVDALV